MAPGDRKLDVLLKDSRTPNAPGFAGGRLRSVLL
jgi:hypothetical protein